MENDIKIYENLIWEILDEGSKSALIEILLNNGFEGECKLISKVEGETTVMEVMDGSEHHLILPINILDILNE